MNWVTGIVSASFLLTCVALGIFLSVAIPDDRAKRKKDRHDAH